MNRRVRLLLAGLLAVPAGCSPAGDAPSGNDSATANAVAAGPAAADPASACPLLEHRRWTAAVRETAASGRSRELVVEGEIALKSGVSFSGFGHSSTDPTQPPTPHFEVGLQGEPDGTTSEGRTYIPVAAQITSAYPVKAVIIDCRGTEIARITRIPHAR